MAVDPKMIEELNIWRQTEGGKEFFQGPWKLFIKLRSKQCETCHHAFEHHGVGDDKTVCWVSGCDCENVTWT